MEALASSELQARSPSDHVTTVLTTTWEALLEVKGIGIDQDFFDLGGNSVMLVAMVDAVCKELGQTLDLAELAEHAATGVTIRVIAHLLTVKPVD